MKENESQTIEEIANGYFDELGVDDDDVGFFSKDQHMPDNGEGRGEQSNSETDSGENESEAGEEPKKDEEKQPERLYAGKFKTVEEMEQAFLNGEAQKHEEIPEKKEEDSLPDASNEDLTTLHEQDEADGTDFTKQYLIRKMNERDLSDFEIEKLKEVQGESDLYGQYIAVKTKRDVMNELKPTLEPIQENQKREEYNQYIEREKQIHESNKSEFGENLTKLQKEVSNPDNIAKILENSPDKLVIKSLYDNGQKALAYKYLLRNAEVYLRNQELKVKSEKKEKSIPADIGGRTTHTKVEKSNSVEDAFNASMQELNIT